MFGNCYTYQNILLLGTHSWYLWPGAGRGRRPRSSGRRPAGGGGCGGAWGPWRWGSARSTHAWGLRTRTHTAAAAALRTRSCASRPCPCACPATSLLTPSPVATLSKAGNLYHGQRPTAASLCLQTVTFQNKHGHNVICWEDFLKLVCCWWID